MTLGSPKPVPDSTWALAMTQRNQAHHEARRRAGLGLSYDDLYQEGLLGLHAAAQKYDPSRGLKFSTIARWWVIAYINRALADHARLIRVPVITSQALSHVRQAVELAGQQGRRVDLDDLAERTGVKRALIDAAVAADRVASLDAPVLDGEQHLSDLVLSDDSWDPVQKLAEDHALQELAALSEDLRVVLVLHAGGCSFAQIGAVVGVTRSAVQLRYWRAVEVLKSKLREPA